MSGSGLHLCAFLGFVQKEDDGIDAKQSQSLPRWSVYVNSHRNATVLSIIDEPIDTHMSSNVDILSIPGLAAKLYDLQRMELFGSHSVSVTMIGVAALQHCLCVQDRQAPGPLR
jgi:hypothetical protein